MMKFVCTKNQQLLMHLSIMTYEGIFPLLQFECAKYSGVNHVSKVTNHQKEDEIYQRSGEQKVKGFFNLQKCYWRFNGKLSRVLSSMEFENRLL